MCVFFKLSRIKVLGFFYLYCLYKWWITCRICWITGALYIIYSSLDELYLIWLPLCYWKHICKAHGLLLSSSVANSVCMCVCVGVYVSEQSLTAVDGCWLAKLPGSFVRLRRGYNCSLFNAQHLFEVSHSIYVLTDSLSLLYGVHPRFFRWVSDPCVVIT